MKDDYLWNGSGEPDPEVRRVEQLLGELRYKGQAPDFSSVPAAAGRRKWWSEWALGLMRRPALAGGIALALVLTLAAGLWLLRRGQAGYDVVALQGAARVGSRQFSDAGHLGAGQWLETGAGSRAMIRIGEIGQVEVEPNTRIGLLRARPAEHRLSLERGTMHALIWAPPRQFFVSTPSATAVDLGCAYTLEVQPSGESLLRVTAGWVSFERDGRESFVPAGALCATRPGIGPGTPYQEDAAPAFRQALSQLDFERLDEQARSQVLGDLLAQARKQDALTLWHMLARGSSGERARVYDRLAALVPPPATVNRDGVLRGDRAMLDQWWNQLGLGDVSRWRLWKGPWPKAVE